MMKKKAYIAPAISVILMEQQPLLSTSDSMQIDRTGGSERELDSYEDIL